MINTLAIHDKIAAICPIDGLSIGRATDKSTWRIDFKKQATDSERQAARELLEAINPSDFITDDVLTPEQKLGSIGLTKDDLRKLLGL